MDNMLRIAEFDALIAPYRGHLIIPLAMKRQSSKLVECKYHSVGPVYATTRAAVEIVFRVVLHGRVFGAKNVPRKGPLILATTHQSFFDPLIVTSPFMWRFCYMARETAFHNPVLRLLLQWLNTFPVKRGTADLAAIKECIRQIRAGYPLIAFPEGTRTSTGKVAPCHPGIIAVAKKTSARLVPTVVEGAFDAWPRHKTWPSVRPIWIEYGTPYTIHPKADSDEEAQLLTKRLRKLHNKLRERIGRPPLDYAAAVCHCSVSSARNPPCATAL